MDRGVSFEKKLKPFFNAKPVFGWWCHNNNHCNNMLYFIDGYLSV